MVRDLLTGFIHDRYMAVRMMSYVSLLYQELIRQKQLLGWLKRVLLPNRFPGVKLDEINDLYEVKDMLAERVKNWTEEWKAQGLEQGLEQGVALTRMQIAKK